MLNLYKNLRVRDKLLFSFIIVLIIAVAAGAYALINMKNINDSYTEAMTSTTERMTYIFEAKEHLADVNMILREFYYPSNTREEIERLHALLKDELNALELSLNNLYAVAPAEIKEKIDLIIPKVEKFRTDTDGIVTRLFNGGRVSQDNPDFRTAQLRAEQMTKNIREEYGDEMMANINNLSNMALDVLNGLSAENSQRANTALYFSLLLFAIMAAVVIIIAVYISGLISKPLVALGSWMKRAGMSGDIAIDKGDGSIIKNYGGQKDEIGSAVNGSILFVNHVTNMSGQLESVANGDLTTKIVPLSEKDVMGQSLKSMIDGLNFMFGEVHAATNQMSMGSRNVAHGSQALAQNSAEQSASVENLSRSIYEISQKTENNFATAEKTSKLSESIKENAEKGALQMEELMEAVKEINKASQEIGKIMNAIDDISFQTNLLALNAAVEAARAGQHGKGFAVVAEEVRKLALRSTEAARETGDLIQNTIEKAELGVRIAGETSVSFAEIVSGIVESNTLIELITDASEDQIKGITGINAGIDQVSRIVQQNSATAEESAAASEEMSTQATVLQELMTRFKIKAK